MVIEATMAFRSICSLPSVSIHILQGLSLLYFITQQGFLERWREIIACALTLVKETLIITGGRRGNTSNKPEASAMKKRNRFLDQQAEWKNSRRPIPRANPC